MFLLMHMPFHVEGYYLRGAEDEYPEFYISFIIKAVWKGKVYANMPVILSGS